MRMRSHFRMPQCEASKASVGHARAYRDILNDALAALAIIRRARRLRTLLVKLGFVLCLMSLFETPRVCIAEAALEKKISNCPMWNREPRLPSANVERECPCLHLLKWPVVGAWCDVSDHLLLFFTARASWRVHAIEATECSRKMVASMLNDSLDCPCFRLHRGDRGPIRGRNSKVGPKPDAGSNPKAGPKPDAVTAGAGARSRARARCGAGA
ncbi:hypothetical protein CRG98_024790 [Punica granatum]|uniref:Uncharacterized protein n=1 Tax=Punica granatum TaxID=22663 RepID=A0A2I0JF23_PUNGR|nr:hypothetical protein CRG98_024790 [Punica granatum]